MMNRALVPLTLAALLLTTAAATAQPIKKIQRDLKDAIERENIRDTENAVKGFLMVNTEAAANELASMVRWLEGQTDNEQIYWIVVKGLASFSNPDPMRAVGRFIVKNKKKAVSRDVMFMIQNNYSISTLELLTIVLASGTDELKVLATDHIGVLQHSDGIPHLLRALEIEKSPEVQRRAGRALYAITGQDLGSNLNNWKGWLEANKGKKFGGAAKEGGGFTERLDKAREQEVGRIKENKPELVVVLKGGPHDPNETKQNGGRPFDHNFDHIEETLEKLGIPHVTVTKEQFEAGFKLTDRMMLLVNCTQWRKHCVCPDCTPGKFSGMRLHRCVCKKNPEVHMPKEYKLSESAVKRIKKFVEKGGYLFTEDWVMGEVLTRAWPKMLKENEYMPAAKDVGVLPAKGQTSHPYLRRIFSKPPKIESSGTTVAPAFDEIKHTWKIDAESPKIGVKDKKNVVTLMYSGDLGSNNAVAVTWIVGGKEKNYIGTGIAGDLSRFTGGRVLHVLSHFGKQKSEDDEYTLLNLLLNFMIEANERWRLEAADRANGNDKRR